jgi:hypothetical protein
LAGQAEGRSEERLQKKATLNAIKRQ